MNVINTGHYKNLRFFLLFIIFEVSAPSCESVTIVATVYEKIKNGIRDWDWDLIVLSCGRDGNGILDFDFFAVGMGMGFGILIYTRSGWEWDWDFPKNPGIWAVFGMGMGLVVNPA